MKVRWKKKKYTRQGLNKEKEKGKKQMINSKKVNEKCSKKDYQKSSKKVYSRSDRAITLIALIVTIIVLLILAGITISMLSRK